MMMVATATRAMQPTQEPVATPTPIIKTTRIRDTMMIARILMIEDTRTNREEPTHKEAMATMMSRKRV